MPDKEIFVIAHDEIVLLLGLLGIESVVLDNPDKFLKTFNNIIKKPSIGMVIVALDLPDDIIDFLIDFKLNNRRPFIFYLPDIFKPNIENENIFLKRISESLSEIIS